MFGLTYALLVVLGVHDLAWWQVLLMTLIFAGMTCMEEITR